MQSNHQLLWLKLVLTLECVDFVLDQEAISIKRFRLTSIGILMFILNMGIPIPGKDDGTLVNWFPGDMIVILEHISMTSVCAIANFRSYNIPNISYIRTFLSNVWFSFEHMTVSMLYQLHVDKYSTHFWLYEYSFNPNVIFEILPVFVYSQNPSYLP